MSTNDSDDKKITNSLGKMSEEVNASTSKLQTNAERIILAADPDEELSVIIRVDTEHYIPEGISPTVKITPSMFTARLRPEKIKQLENDVRVMAIELSEKLRKQ